MGVIKQQGIRSSVVIYIGFAVGALNTMILFPRFFTPEEFGLTRLLYSAALTFVQLALLGSNSILVKFFPHYRDYLQKRDNDLLWVNLLVALTGFVAVTTFAFIFKDNILAFYEKKSLFFIRYAHLVFPFAFFFLLYYVFEAYTLSHYRSLFPSMVRELFFRLYTTLIILLYVAGIFHYAGFITLFSLFYFFGLLLILAYLYRIGHLHIRTRISRLTKRLGKKMLSYGAFIYGGNLLLVLSDNVDTFMIAGISGLQSTAVFAIASYVATVIQVPQRSLSNISLSVVARAWKDKNMDSIRTAYRKSSINQLVAALFIFLLIWLNIDNIYSALNLPAVYEQGKQIILVLALAKIIDAGTGINTEILLTSNVWRVNFYTQVVLLAMLIPMNYIFIGRFGIIGSAYSSLIAFTLFNIIRFAYLWKKFNLQPFGVKTLAGISVAVASYLLASWIPPMDNHWLDMLLRGCVFCIFYATGTLGFRISDDINQLAYTLKNSFR